MRLVSVPSPDVLFEALLAHHHRMSCLHTDAVEEHLVSRAACPHLIEKGGGVRAHDERPPLDGVPVVH
jgi:hypothetical protein